MAKQPREFVQKAAARALPEWVERGVYVGGAGTLSRLRSKYGNGVAI